jgi:uncharacterized membrane protein
VNLGGDRDVSETALGRRRMSDIENTIAGLRARMPAEAGEAVVAMRVVYAAVLVYAVLFAFAAVLHYTVFEMARFDLGNMVQAIWNTLHGHVLQTTTLDGHQRSRLGYHVDPFLVLLAPLAWLSALPQILLALQAIAVAIGALPVFWLARKHLGSPKYGAMFAVAYLLYPATQFNAYTIGDGFHPVSFAVPLILFAIWFLDEGRLVAFSVAALLACSTKEELGLSVGCLGIWYAVRSGNRLFGFGVFAAGLVLTLVNFLWVIPHYAPNGVEPFAGRYTVVGGTPHGIVHKAFTDPGAFVHAVATGHKATYVLLLFVPFLGLSLLEPLLLLGAVPDLVINLLSDKGEQTSIAWQYTAGIAPFVVAASVFGAARLMKGRKIELPLWVCAGCAAVALYSPIYLGASDVKTLGSPLVAAKEHAMGLIPSEAPVAASNQLAGHLSARRIIYTFPSVRRARWIIVDPNDDTYMDAKGYQRVIRKYRMSNEWRAVYSSHGVTVLHKRSTAGG